MKPGAASRPVGVTLDRMSNTRNSEDGFKGQYPNTEDDWVVRAYREAGMEPPWLLEWKDGKPVGPADPDQPAPRHEA